MKIKFFSIPANDSEAAQKELNTFLSGHRIAAVEKNFVTDGGHSFWAICVSYLDKDKSSPIMGKTKVDYREVLEEKEFAVFVKLRNLRKTLAEKEGVPAYALFTNEQLAHMVRHRVGTLAGLSEIDGVGKSRLDKYGKQFLKILKEEYTEYIPEDNKIEPNKNHNETIEN